MHRVCVPAVTALWEDLGDPGLHQTHCSLVLLDKTDHPSLPDVADGHVEVLHLRHVHRVIAGEPMRLRIHGDVALEGGVHVVPNGATPVKPLPVLLPQVDLPVWAEGWMFPTLHANRTPVPLREGPGDGSCRWGEVAAPLLPVVQVLPSPDPALKGARQGGRPSWPYCISVLGDEALLAESVLR
eukprot:CAMPEP_0197892202 /NCGR_PEP_ID=MMETSP1439-20131203/30020_1 /TAXON_ID=66791 /ORGANISM="Gonyaulax spinifera, Strain CCMP409" /LENGTH=183 /DNA_ID=CAMNT_0043512355 /DNA_START=302 /DNA_END=856 /DNA_ORIENTATION=-